MKFWEKPGFDRTQATQVDEWLFQECLQDAKDKFMKAIEKCDLVVEKNEKSLWRFINEKIKTIEGVRPQMDVSSYIDVFKMNHKINFKIE